MLNFKSPLLPDAAVRAARITVHPMVDRGVLWLCVALVLAIRIELLVATDFPINDGALFLAFVEAIVPVFPSIPQTVEYNGIAIPFAYPPLSFWLAAGGVRLGLDPLDIVHRAPILMNIGYVLLFTLVLLRTGHSRLFTAVAVLVFGTTFRSYEFLVMGGGLSRGLGSLFLLLTLLVLLPQGGTERAQRSLRRLLLGGVLVGGAVLSHLEWGMLTAFSAVLCLAFPWPGWVRLVRGSVIVGAMASLLVAPWLGMVYLAHGLAPFVAASGTSAWQPNSFINLGRMLTRTSFIALPLVLFGMVTAARTRDVFWVVFLLAAAILTPRSGETPLVLALGVLAASGFITLVALVRQRGGPALRPMLAGLLLLGVAMVVLRSLDAQRRDPHFAVLPAELRSAMSWIAQTHPGATFAVLKEAPWFYNAAAEWFPVLARAVNVTTLQGREWLPDQEFARTYEAIDQLDSSTSCPAVLQRLAAFRRPDFVWAEGVDFAARAAELSPSDRRRALGERLAALRRRVTGAPPAEAFPGWKALHGPGTLAHCFEQAGYAEVHANARVRIFAVPGQRSTAAQEQ
ncbi:MAG: hypothetical protein H0X13_16805 [Ramlibacter sp.]|nr:hypothetical protein [Ramlibacter sp.]